jgi:hypothetical protein
MLKGKETGKGGSVLCCTVKSYTVTRHVTCSIRQQNASNLSLIATEDWHLLKITYFNYLLKFIAF